jgi:hypothetical protein
VTRDQAVQEAQRRNTDGSTKRDRFWIEVEREDGSWTVEQREPEHERMSWRRRIAETVVEALTWW